MATATPPPSTSNPKVLVHNLALAGIIICPILLFLPPRKLDSYTWALIAGIAVSGNQLTEHYTGRGFPQRIQDDMAARRAWAARKYEEMEKNAEIKQRNAEGMMGKMNMGTGEERKGVMEEIHKRQEEEEARRAKKANWKVERDRREKEAEEEGRGIGDLITDQMWEVWNWRKRGDNTKDEGGDEQSDGKKDGKR